MSLRLSDKRAKNLGNITQNMIMASQKLTSAHGYQLSLRSSTTACQLSAQSDLDGSLLKPRLEMSPYSIRPQHSDSI